MFRFRSLFKNSRRSWSVAALGLSALLLVSCGGDDEDEPTEEAATTAPIATEVVTEEAAASPDVANPDAGMASPVVASPVVGAATPVAGASTPSAFVVGTPVLNQASPVASPVVTGPVDVAETPELGQFLTDSEGMTLYIFTNDVPDTGTSVCNDDCAVNWPPFYTEDMTLPADVNGELTVVTRNDGSEQLAFNGMPLYYWANDAAPGDTTGHEVGDVWFVAAVGADGTPMASPAS